MRVLHVHPWGPCHPIRSGADAVAANQLAYFASRGWEVHHLTGQASDDAVEALRREVPSLASITELPVALKGHLRHNLLEFVSLRRHPALQSILSRSYDVVFTNYVFTAPLLDLATRSRRRILETVDILADGWSVFEEGVAGDRNPGKIAATRAYLRRVEADLYTLFDRVVFLSRADHEAAQRAGVTNGCFIPPHVPDESVSGTQALAPTDLLFVGSAYPPNRDGIDWFYHSVFLPHLRPMGTTLTIIGSVCRLIDMREDPQVRLIPFLEGSLAPAYAATKLALVPIFEGTGVAIKTIEALGFGAAIYTTPVGARGLPDIGDAMIIDPMKPDPAATASAILALVSDPARRERLSEAARRAYEAHFSRDVYDRRLTTMFTQLGLL
ncbi:MAG: glycosyltransferase family 4 protein [Labrys sp. (in: a-proteobacteria)]